ncbi:MAG: excinuclease ABC subunit C, partial [Verrucomicrobia bacterium]|nr:excinuclease ABC subunit C [Cytophagales bacterium]
MDFDYKEILKKLPEQPGVYRFFDLENEILYVGKAKNLKSRVSSYFNKSAGHTYKTEKLVAQIRNIEFTIVNTEYDALLLENNLIKQFQPRYNILLKDDKTYPFICVSNVHFPKIFPTRRPEKNTGTFFGPYANGKLLNTLLELLPKLYTLRTCSLNLTPKNIAEKKFKVCLEYHLGNCKGPCEALQSETDYNKDIEQVQQILKGNLAPAKQYFVEKMQEAATNLAFEKAQYFKEKLALLENYQGKSLIVNPKMDEADVFAVVSDEKALYLNFIKVANGLVVQTKNLEVKRKLDETDSEILTMLVVEIRNEFGSQAKEILSNIELSADMLGITHHIPQIGDKKKLVDLSLKNALYFKKERTEAELTQREKKEQRDIRVLQQLQKDLQLKDLPRHIECFDNSNMQGTNPVAAMVCFKNAFPSKKDYRHFNIKTVFGPDDFASMNEIVGRRYARLLNENSPLPDLIIVDGGKGQLSAAIEALEKLGIYGQIPIIGIAKRLEEIYFPGDSLPLYISKKSESLKLIQRIRDEAHRFAITFHRDQRSRN